MPVRLLTRVLIVALINSSAVFAFQASPSAPDVTGAWTGKFVITKEGAPPAEESAYASLKQTGTSIAGTVGPTPERQFAITDGKVVTTKESTTISFKQGREGRWKYFELKLVDGGLKGTVKDEFYGTTMGVELQRAKGAR